MTNTRTTTTEAEHRHGIDATPHDRVEVFDANSGSATHSGDTMKDAEHRETDLSNSDFTNPTLRNNTLGDTDFRDSTLRTTDRMDAGTTTGTIDQGTNWGTILMVIAIILVIILLGSWLF